jgi:alkylated DNA repair dioxygenase AlkB
LAYRPEFVTSAEEASLMEAITGLEFSEVRFHGQAARRTVVHLGVDYNYDAGSVTPSGPLPDWLGWLRDRCAALAGLSPPALVEALVTRYPPGATIGWHRDAPAFGSSVIGVSFGAACRMRFRRTLRGAAKPSLYELVLEPRSAYVLSGAARWSWQHSIPAVKQMRHSITFRSLRRPGADGG